MNIQGWKDQYDAICYRLANEKENLVTLIKCMANELLEKEGFDKFVKLEESGLLLGLDDNGETIVGWADCWSIDLIDLPIDELRDMGSSLYWDKYEVVNNKEY